MSYRGYGIGASSLRLDSKYTNKNMIIHKSSKDANYWNQINDDKMREGSPGSSHSINTPLKQTSSSISNPSNNYNNNNSNILINRPGSKEKFSNKSEQTSTFSRFSSKVSDIPLEKSVNIEKAINNGSKLMKDYEEEKANFFNFKKKEENFQNISKTYENTSNKQENYKHCVFPYQPKMKMKREMGGLRNIGNTCFL